MNNAKGGMDLFMTKFHNGNWSAPVALDFVNTDQDDQFVSVSALGRYLVKEAPGPRKNTELVEFLIPDELRSKGMMKVEGKITDSHDAPIPAYITVIDKETSKRVYSGRPGADGSYFLYLQEGAKYEFSVDAEQSKISFFAKEFDLTGDKIPQRERANVILKEPAADDEFLLDLIRFKPLTSELDPASENEIKRLVRLVKANAQLIFEIQVTLNGYEEDSVQSSPDLTESVADSIHMQIDDIDSLGQVYKRDTVIVKTRFHNDRTQAQADRIVEYLVRSGANANNLKTTTTAIPAVLPENRRLVVKAIARGR
jgi:hypothetical protein